MEYAISIGWRMIIFGGKTRLNLEGEVAEGMGGLSILGKEWNE